MRKNRWWAVFLAGGLLVPMTGCLDLTTPRIPDQNEEDENDTPEGEDGIARSLELTGPIRV